MLSESRAALCLASSGSPGVETEGRIQLTAEEARVGVYPAVALQVQFAVRRWNQEFKPTINPVPDTQPGKGSHVAAQGR